jgi:hypothetical protein
MKHLTKWYWLWKKNWFSKSNKPIQYWKVTSQRFWTWIFCHLCTLTGTNWQSFRFLDLTFTYISIKADRPFVSHTANSESTWADFLYFRVMFKRGEIVLGSEAKGFVVDIGIWLVKLLHLPELLQAVSEHLHAQRIHSDRRHFLV